MGSKIALKNAQDQEFSINHLDNAGAIAINSSDIAIKTDLKEIGVGQTWQDVTASRASNVTYTNSTGKPIMVLICTAAAQNCSIDVTISGSVFHRMAHNAPSGVLSNKAAIEFIVPNGITYSAVIGGVIEKWNELR